MENKVQVPHQSILTKLTLDSSSYVAKDTSKHLRAQCKGFWSRCVKRGRSLGRGDGEEGLEKVTWGGKCFHKEPR